MGDHLVLVVDCMLTEKTAGAAIDEIRNEAQKTPSEKSNGDLAPSGRLVDCRICQEEDEESNMEAPCSCCGSLKYAHRVCVQRWCNEKGDNMCEICLQQFVPGYISSPKLFDDGRISTNFRGNWEISPQDAHYDPYLTSAPTNNYFIGPEYDYYSTSNRRSIWYCRSVAIIFTILLILRHALPILISGAEHYSQTLFTPMRTEHFWFLIGIGPTIMTTLQFLHNHPIGHLSNVSSRDGSLSAILGQFRVK